MAPATRGTLFRKKEKRVDDPKRRKPDRNVEVENSHTVKGMYERRITHSQSDLLEQHNESSRRYHEWLRPVIPRNLEDCQGCNINRSADDIMKITGVLTSVEDHNSTPSSRGDPVKLSRRTAVKRNSTKDRKTKTEKHDSAMQDTCAPGMTSAHTSGIERTMEEPPLISRRFSFEQPSSEESLDVASREDATEVSSMLDFQDVPLTPASESSQLRLPTEAHQRHRQTRVEHDQTTEPQGLGRERRRVPTTFDEILGPRKIPTALL